MKTQANTIASILAACIWADGEYEEVERITADEIADAFDIPEKDFNKYMTAAVVEVQNLSPEAVTDYAVKHAAKVIPEERDQIFEAVLQMMLCDSVLTDDEVYNSLAIAEAMEINRDKAILMLCDMVQSEPEIKIELND